MWGTFMLDIYRRDHAADLRDALEELLGPQSGSAWSTGGVYLFWDPGTRKPLYVGIAGDFPVRFAQHNGLRSCPAAGCKREQVASYFAEHDQLGYTIATLSSLSQPSTARQREVLDLKDRDLIELNEALSAQAVNEMRNVEGRLIADARMRFGETGLWNTAVGRVPRKKPDHQDGTLALAVGAFDSLLQARKTIRGLASNGEWALFEERLHGARLAAVRRTVLSGFGRPDDLIREELGRGLGLPGISDVVGDAIETTGYLEQRCPVAIGPGALGPGPSP
jgi:predicted GIY-YIG superfamily endonuclease